MNLSSVSSSILSSLSPNNGTQIASSNVQPTSSVNSINKTAKTDPSESLTPSQVIVVEAEQQLETNEKERRTS